LYIPNKLYDNNGVALSPAPSTLTAVLVPQYLSSPLKDPLSGGSPQAGYVYKSDATGSSYCIMSLIRPEDLRDFPTESVSVDMNRCGQLGANGQCRISNNIFYSSIKAATC